MKLKTLPENIDFNFGFNITASIHPKTVIHLCGSHPVKKKYFSLIDKI